MFEISIRQIKNCMLKLELIELDIKKAVEELNHVYANFDSLVEGKMDRQVLKAVIEEVSAELKGIISLREILIQVVKQYETAERKITNLDIFNIKKDDFKALDLRAVSKTMESLGVIFE